MANQLKMAKIHAIDQLHSLHWSQRRIARELGIDRGTVGRYLRRRLGRAKTAISITGSDGSNAAILSDPPGPASDAIGDDGGSAGAAASNAAISITGSMALTSSLDTVSAPQAAAADVRSPPGRRNLCEPHQAFILAKLEHELTAQRIYQDLRDEHSFTGSYSSVRRFVQHLREASSVPVRRLECAPGEEAQIDFGTGAPVITSEGKRRGTYVFRIVLSHSRKGYCEATYRQTTEDFLRSLENAFQHFAGVPKTLVIDNLKAAVKQPDWFDPELVPKLHAFCQHYGTVILPTRPRTPQHKGKIEAGIKYVKRNGLKGRHFTSLEEQNRFLADWETRIADTRIHGTTKRQVRKVFAECERSKLLPLPLERFACFQEAQRKVNRDGHVEVAKAYYSAPPEYLGRTVWVRWDARLVRIFNHRFEQVALHLRQENGRFSTQAQHIAREKISGLERGVEYLLGRLAPMGPHTRQWAEAMLVARGIQGTRVLLGLVSLTKRHSPSALEKACEIALSYSAFQLRTLRQLVGRHATSEQLPLEFVQEHPLIRPLDDYAAVVAAALERTAQRRDGNKEEERKNRVFSGMTEQKHVAGSWGEQDVSSLCNRTASMVATTEAAADLLPPRSGYPSSGCSPAEPDSVSPNTTSVLPVSSTRPGESHE